MPEATNPNPSKQDQKKLRKGERTRLAIIETAMTFFMEKGFHSTQFLEIGRKLNIANPTVFKHFPTREDLLVACAQHAIAQGRAFIDTQIDPNQPARLRLKAYIDANVSLPVLHPKIMHTYFCMYYAGLTSKPIRELHTQVDDFSMARIQTHIIHGNREGDWDVAHPVKAARAIHSMVAGEIIKTLRFPEEFDLEERKRSTWNAVRSILGLKPA